MSLPYTLRPFNPDTDFPRHIEIRNAFEPIKLTIDLAKENYNTKPAGMIERELVAVDQNGYVVAVGNTGCAPWMFDTRRFWIGITVDPDVHHRGIGTMLYNDLYAF